MASLSGDIGVNVKTSITTALEYLFGRLKDVRPVTVTVSGQDYAVRADGTVGDPIRELRPIPTIESPTLLVSTLSALVTAVKAGIDKLDAGTVGVRVADIHTVEVISLVADEYGRRHMWAQAKHQLETKFEFDKYYQSPEAFLIAFRSSFYFNEEAVKVQQLCSAVGSGDAVAVTDDGVSQQIRITAGTVTRNTIDLPADGVPLIPWRTFRDATPVESKFLLRMKGVKDGLPQIALFEIDAKWRVDTMQSIAGYLTAALPGVTVIA
jgi:hypothetical protein